MWTANVTIEGVAPGLLMHRFGEATTAQLLNPVKARSKSNSTPEDDAEECAYRLVTGELCQPSEHIFQALVKAAGEFQVQGRGKKTYKDAIKGGVLVEPEYIPHEQDTYLIDSRPVRIQKARIVRHRPHLASWRLSFQLQVIDDSVSREVMNAILVRAGQTVGIGDYRPRFGRFVVSKFE